MNGGSVAGMGCSTWDPSIFIQGRYDSCDVELSVLAVISDTVISDTVISDTKVCCEDVNAIIAGCIVACQALPLPWPLS